MTDMEDTVMNRSGILPDVFADERRMYTLVESLSRSLGMKETPAALAFAGEKHEGQFRKTVNSAQGEPYISHPLTMACHAFAMGLNDDDVISALLLHDVVEDTGTSPENLPVNDRVREAVRLVSKNSYTGPKEEKMPRYFVAIAENPLASLVKCVDRCHNLACMHSGFSRKKQAEYIEETEKYILPLIKEVRKVPEWDRAAWLLEYQMTALVETYRELLGTFSQ